MDTNENAEGTTPKTKSSGDLSSDPGERSKFLQTDDFDTPL